ncbi:hypothetical protein GCM10018790_38030 [Kitasatospora xanthocidica]|uniref:hypothetical protein n=1 Tax=Kitasatospora xanthocidica TaxID=83382 RepID=UPI00198955C0|nr:hypothetical protein [Kitasatospora xanthocidica]GHF56431.1 hypothetical protein GCM10018790_38030 [Kitasatospora xanthocidica]
MARVTWAGSEVRWVRRLGRLLAVVREVDGRLILRIDDWSTVVDEWTAVHHRTGPLRHRIVVRQPGRFPVEFRYRLRWTRCSCGRGWSPCWNGSGTPWPPPSATRRR